MSVVCRLLVCGSRTWDNPSAIYDRISKIPYRDYKHGYFGYILPEKLTIIHGACPRGADAFVDSLFGHDPDVVIERYPANWERDGKAAGPIRNQKMLDQGRPDLVLAFTNDLNQSRGTADMVRRARYAGISVEIIPDRSEP